MLILGLQNSTLLFQAVDLPLVQISQLNLRIDFFEQVSAINICVLRTLFGDLEILEELMVARRGLQLPVDLVVMTFALEDGVEGLVPVN